MTLDRDKSATQTSMDTVLDILANKYRRRLLFALLEHNPQEDDDIQIPSDIHIENEDLKGLKIEMVHVHLPKLEEASFIMWDREVHEVRVGPQFEEIRPLLQLMRDNADKLPEGWL